MNKQKARELSIEEKYGAGAGYGVDPEVNAAALYSDALRLEAQNEELVKVCKATLEDLLSGAMVENADTMGYAIEALKRVIKARG